MDEEIKIGLLTDKNIIDQIEKLKKDCATLKAENNILNKSLKVFLSNEISKLDGDQYEKILRIVSESEKSAKENKGVVCGWCYEWFENAEQVQKHAMTCNKNKPIINLQSQNQRMTDALKNILGMIEGGINDDDDVSGFLYQGDLIGEIREMAQLGLGEVDHG